MNKKASAKRKNPAEPKAKAASKPASKAASESAAKPKPKAKPGAEPAAKPAPKPAAKSSAKKNPAPPISFPSGTPSAAPSAAKTREGKIVPVMHEDIEEDLELDLPRKGGSGRDKDGLENVMASLSKIFGGRDFLSDADLDAFLDSKIASGEIPPSAALDPLDEAQSLIYEAWNTEGPEKISLAHRALDLSENCADAYVILADEEAKTLPASLALYRKGVDAAKRALDPSIFAKSAGKFWDIMETRPYMRARLGLAECLWDLSKKAEALEHLRDLLRLNPADDQGVRYILVQCLLESGADEELGALLARYGEDSTPEFRYTHALWSFRHAGPGKDSDALLAKAIAANPHVPAYLLKRKKLPKDVPDSADPGSVEEAEAYASGAVDPWHRTLGALEWLASNAPE
jgi:tetratricopeptide (TPR) repeat protein